MIMSTRDCLAGSAGRLALTVQRHEPQTCGQHAQPGAHCSSDATTCAAIASSCSCICRSIATSCDSPTSRACATSGAQAQHHPQRHGCLKPCDTLPSKQTACSGRALPLVYNLISKVLQWQCGHGVPAGVAPALRPGSREQRRLRCSALRLPAPLRAAALRARPQQPLAAPCEHRILFYEPACQKCKWAHFCRHSSLATRSSRWSINCFHSGSPPYEHGTRVMTYRTAA